MANMEEILMNTLSLTKEGRLSWTVSASNSYMVRAGDLRLTVSGSEGMAVFTVHDKDGTTIDSNISSEAGDLFGLARRKALNVDQKLENVAKWLKDQL